jgi:DUF971 family protein
MATADPSDIFEASPSELGITWKDGHRSVYSLQHLRASCPCATCNDIRTKFGPLVINRDTIKAKGIEPVGRYALQVLWNDGHQTGIYAWEFLREICPCPECAKRATGQAASAH